MAVKPEELIRNLELEVDGFEKVIDSNLKGRKILTGQSISVAAPEGFTSMHFPILKDRYISAGWKNVVFTSTQRDGNYIEFKT